MSIWQRQGQGLVNIPQRYRPLNELLEASAADEKRRMGSSMLKSHVQTPLDI